MIGELEDSRYFDVFEYSGQWGCFLCNHPDRAAGFNTEQPLIQGVMKEKKGKWKMFKRWRTKYFTLSGAHLTSKGSVSAIFSPFTYFFNMFSSEKFPNPLVTKFLMSSTGFIILYSQNVFQ